jgi:hypothetical protein
MTLAVVPVIRLCAGEKHTWHAITSSRHSACGIPERTVKALFRNCATIAGYRVSGEDAEELVREFGSSGKGHSMPTVPSCRYPSFRTFLITVCLCAHARERRSSLSGASPCLSAALPSRHGEDQRHLRRQRVLRTRLKRSDANATK